MEDKKNIKELSEKLEEALSNDKLKLTKEEKLELIKEEVEKNNFTFIDEKKLTKYSDDFLGNGTYGKVYRSKYGDIDTAIKELEIEKVFKDIKALLQEINMSIITFHDRVPKFHGAYFMDDFICLIFDLVKGQSLTKFNEHVKPDLKFKMDLLIQLVEIMNDLHKQNIIHRDLKPENIIVNDDNKVFLIDFGTSKIVNDSKTRTFSAKGTTFYMGPENFKVDAEEERPIEISCAFDIWSLGCIISQLTSGIMPWFNYPRKKLNEIFIMSLLTRETPFPIPETLPEDVKLVLEDCFKIQSEDRIKTEDLLKKLKEIRDNLK